jgi:apolipoprotein N-acyltransferase
MRYYWAVLTHTMLQTIFAALLFPLALPNELFALGSPLLGAIALVPFYLALRDTDSARHAARLGALFGGLSTVIANYWLMFFGDYSVWTIGGTTIGYIGYNWVLAGFLWKATRAPVASRPVLFAMVWTLYEYAKSIGFLAYPWGLAAYPLNDLTLFTQLVDVTGVWGLTFLVVYANTTIAELAVPRGDGRPGAVVGSGVPRARRLPVAISHVPMVGLLIIVTLGYGAMRVRTDVPIADTLDLVLVQQNADAWNTRDVALPLRKAQEETDAAIATLDAAPDLIVWSETSLRYFYTEGRDWYARNPPERPFLEFVADLPAPLLTGTPFQDPDDEFAVYNAVVKINPDTRVEQWYGKQHLVPFAEAIPFWDSEAVREFFGSVIGISGVWAPGPGPRLFTVTGNRGTEVAIATPICFEDGVAYVNRRFIRAGADLIVNLTNNAWSRTDSAQLQHFVAARFRAIETRRGLVRSTNSGYSAVVDPWGRITESIPMFETSSLVTTVPVYAPATESVYVRWGDYVPQVFGLILAGLFVVGLLRERATRRD